MQAIQETVIVEKIGKKSIKFELPLLPTDPAFPLMANVKVDTLLLAFAVHKKSNSTLDTVNKVLKVR